MRGREGGRGGHRALKWGTWTPSQNRLGSREITTRVSYFKSLTFKVCHRKSFKEPEKKKKEKLNLPILIKDTKMTY